MKTKIIKMTTLLNITRLTKEQAPYIVAIAQERVKNLLKGLSYQELKLQLAKHPITLCVLIDPSEKYKHLIMKPDAEFKLHSELFPNYGTKKESMIVDFGFGHEKELTDMILGTLPKYLTGVPSVTNRTNASEVLYNIARAKFDEYNNKRREQLRKLKEPQGTKVSSKDLNDIFNNLVPDEENTRVYKYKNAADGTIYVDVTVTEDMLEIKFNLQGVSDQYREFRFTVKVNYSGKAIKISDAKHKKLASILERLKENSELEEDIFKTYAHTQEELGDIPFLGGKKEYYKFLQESNYSFVLQ